MTNSTGIDDANYQFDDLTVDRAHFRLLKGQELRPIQPRAFDLLVYLIENRDRVVEKQELFENVWKESFVTDNALTRAIKEIRHELDDDASEPRYIATIHKRGYRFIGNLAAPASLSSKDLLETKEMSRGGEQTAALPDAWSIDRNKRIRIAAGSDVLIFLIIAVLIYFLGGKVQQVRSLAVLPLENSTGNP